jgi:hypothetical protein
LADALKVLTSATFFDKNAQTRRLAATEGIAHSRVLARNALPHIL